MKNTKNLPALQARHTELVNPLFDWFDSAFVDFWNNWGPFNVSTIKTRTYPKVDISEVGEDVIVEAIVPFVKKEDLKVSLDNGVLTISGEIQKSETIDKKYYKKESTSRSSFVRSFPINDSVWAEWTKGAELEDLVNAQLKDGVLTVTLKGISKNTSEPAARPPTLIEIEEAE